MRERVNDMFLCFPILFLEDSRCVGCRGELPGSQTVQKTDLIGRRHSFTASDIK